MNQETMLNQITQVSKSGETIIPDTWERTYKRLKISKEGFDLLDKISRGNSRYRKFISYLILCPLRDYDDCRLIIPRQIAADCQNLRLNERTAVEFYKEIRKQVFDPAGGTFEWSAYAPNKCRRVLELDFGVFQKEVDRISSLGYFVNLNQNDLVYLNSGIKPNRQKIADTVKEFVSSARPARCKAARKLQCILNGKNTKFYTELLKKNLGSTVKLLEKIHRENPDKPYIYQTESSKLRNIWQYPKPIYYPSEKEHTSRLFTKNHIPNLMKVLRLELTRGLVEVDLMNSQLAINSRNWQMKEIEEILQRDGNIWKSLKEDHGLSEADFKLVKPALKRAIYIPCYGGKKQKIIEKVTEDLGIYSRIISVEKIISHPIVNIILKAASKQLREIKKNKGGIDAFGEFIPMTKERTARSILAQISQSYELYVLLPVAEYLETTTSKMVIWMHDGYTMIKGRDFGKVKQRCEQIVREKLNEKGICSGLEWSE
jgi:hypothetical protein